MGHTSPGASRSGVDAGDAPVARERCVRRWQRVWRRPDALEDPTRTEGTRNDSGVPHGGHDAPTPSRTHVTMLDDIVSSCGVGPIRRPHGRGNAARICRDAIRERGIADTVRFGVSHIGRQPEPACNDRLTVHPTRGPRSRDDATTAHLAVFFRRYTRQRPLAGPRTVASMDQAAGPRAVASVRRLARGARGTRGAFGPRPSSTCHD